MHPAPFKGNLVITNLPPDMTGTELAELFDRFGMVIGAEIRSIPAVAGKATIGVVALAPDAAVDRAIDAINLTMVGDRRVKVGRAKQRPPKPRGMTASSNGAAPAGRAPAYPASATQAAKPPKTVIVEYKPRRRLASNA